MTCRADRLWEEIVYIGYHLHWSFDEIARLDHRSRRQVLTEIGKLDTEPGEV
ncbi:DUF6760 family protein [Amycolatopsis sp. cg5]|uniref:DUF6760 family protein n=1 Tax=Amycolatopsis sp. cg5 TaxID=3238802 RepID=UPI0035245F99